MSQEQMNNQTSKRAPKIYVCGSTRDPFVRSVKMDFMANVAQKHNVTFLDPVRHPHVRDDYEGIVDINTIDIQESDLIVTVTNDKIGPGTAIEMYIGKAAMKKAIMLFINMKNINITPHIRSICGQSIYPLHSVTEIVDRWVVEWYRA